MRIGIYLRNMGPQATPASLVACARAAEAAGLDDAWVVDHIAIPPDDAEGSGGRYLDPMTTLAFLAAATETIGLGVAVLVLPYRERLATAKAVATVQELSGGRLRLGIGAGWMPAEFRALGLDRRRRGAVTDDTLAFIARCFEADRVKSHGQEFLFLPRPEAPPIYVGGAEKAAFERVLAHGDGWMPMVRDPADFAEAIARLRERAEAAKRPRPQVIACSGFLMRTTDEDEERLAAFQAAGFDGVIHSSRYDSVDEFARMAERLGELKANARIAG